MDDLGPSMYLCNWGWLLGKLVSCQRYSGFWWNWLVIHPSLSLSRYMYTCIYPCSVSHFAQEQCISFLRRSISKGWIWCAAHAELSCLECAHSRSELCSEEWHSELFWAKASQNCSEKLKAELTRTELMNHTERPNKKLFQAGYVWWHWNSV